MDRIGNPGPRRHTISDRLAILAEYEAAEHGRGAAVIRRHGIATTTLHRWRRQKRAGLLEPSQKKESRLVMTKKERADYLHLQKENAELKSQLAQAESTVEVLGKASALLESLAKSAQPHQQGETDQSEPEPEAGWAHRYSR